MSGVGFSKHATLSTGSTTCRLSTYLNTPRQDLRQNSPVTLGHYGVEHGSIFAACSACHHDEYRMTSSPTESMSFQNGGKKVPTVDFLWHSSAPVHGAFGRSGMPDNHTPILKGGWDTFFNETIVLICPEEGSFVRRTRWASSESKAQRSFFGSMSAARATL